MNGCMFRAIGPAALAIGCLLVASRWYETSVPGTAEEVDAKSILKKDDNHVRLSGVELDWERRVLAAYEGVNKVTFYERDPRPLTEIADPRELLSRGDELLHTFVRVTTPAPLEGGNYYFYKRVRKDAQGRVIEGSQTDAGTLIFAPLEGTGGALWIATEPVSAQGSPEAKAALARTTHVGELTTLFDVISDPALDQAYARGHGGAKIPSRALALEVRPQPKTRRVEVWVPVSLKPTERNKLWVALPEPTEAPPVAPFQGIFYRMPQSEYGALGHFLSERRRESPFGGPGLLVLGTPAHYQARMGWERVHRTGILLSVAGVLLTALLFVGGKRGTHA